MGRTISITDNIERTFGTAETALAYAAGSMHTNAIAWND
jgi:hypothetical protein